MCAFIFFFLAEDRYISFESMFSLLRRCMLPMVLQNLLRREPLKLVDGGQSQRTFVYIKDAIEAVVLMIVCYLPLSPTPCYSQIQWDWTPLFFCPCFQFWKENPARANGHIFNVGNPNNEVTVRELAQMMTEVCHWMTQIRFVLLGLYLF